MFRTFREALGGLLFIGSLLGLVYVAGAIIESAMAVMV